MGLFSKIAKGLGKIVGGVGKAIGGVVKGVGTAVGGVFKGAGQILTGDIGGGLGTMVGGVFKGAKQAVGGVVDGAVTVASGALDVASGAAPIVGGVIGFGLGGPLGAAAGFGIGTLGSKVIDGVNQNLLEPAIGFSDRMGQEDMYADQAAMAPIPAYGNPFAFDSMGYSGGPQGFAPLTAPQAGNMSPYGNIQSNNLFDYYSAGSMANPYGNSMAGMGF